VAALEALDGALRGGAEDAVDGDPEPALQQPDAAALRGAARAGPARGRAAAVRRAPQGGPGGGADDAVGCEPVTALERLDRTASARAEDAVRPDPEPALGLAHPRALRALLERLRRGVRGGRGERGGRREHAGGGQREGEQEDGPLAAVQQRVRQIRSVPGSSVHLAPTR
jgi:hypothetical protein